MSVVTEEMVLAALARVTDEKSGRDVVSAGLISGLAVQGGKVGFLITIERKDKDVQAQLREACERAVKTLPGVISVTAVMTAETSPADATSSKRPAVWNVTPVEHVKKIIAVASGKGGVGKSTTAVNLALALKNQGRRVGLLDADIYGPSIPRMLGVSGQPAIEDGKMIPLMAHGIACMSVGFITGNEAAILRGPMISKTLMQMLRATRWGTETTPLDVLLVDMPPGTGDVHLSMAQQVPLNGAIIVTTPQEVALADARKSAIMFQKVGVKLLGVIENMSWFEADSTRQYIFGQGGGQKLADEFSIPLLGQLPIDPEVGHATDNGLTYEGKLRHAYISIAAQLP